MTFYLSPKSIYILNPICQIFIFCILLGNLQKMVDWFILNKEENGNIALSENLSVVNRSVKYKSFSD